ncbi:MULTISPECIES: GEVED domain-containing protein [unclassified Roseitalea]|uniref:GEVED domain-containing protein n=1 Tax=unclassified Roseitalea TaxID=2639107 RepID=UPI00273D66DC|nr:MULTISPECIES: GEVED domain-containing protein [unclassified Roseitalea]
MTQAGRHAAARAVRGGALATLWGAFAVATMIALPARAQPPETFSDGSDRTANMVLWLDADDTGTIYTDSACTASAGNGDQVACWADKSSNGHDVTIGDTSGFRPEYVSSDALFGGRAVLDFDGNDRLINNIPDVNTNNFTLFMVLASDDPNPSNLDAFFSNANAPGNNGSFQITYRSASDSFDVPFTGITDRSFGPFEDNVIKLYGMRARNSPSNLLELFSEGTLVDSANENMNFVFRLLKINSNRNTSSFHDSRIAEVILYDAALSDCQLSEVNAYLGAKYGADFTGAFENLYTSGHPENLNRDAIGRNDFSNCLGPQSDRRDSATSAEMTFDVGAGAGVNDMSGDYVITAHQGGDVTQFTTTTVASVGADYRVPDRHWRLEEQGSGDLGNDPLSFSFDYAAMGLTAGEGFALLVSPDRNFANAEVVSTSFAVDTGTGTVTFDPVVLNTSGDTAALDLEPYNEGTGAGDLFVTLATAPVDRSDAPVAGTSYGEATHAVTAGLQLGLAIDADATPLASPDADGDDTNGTDDEDGVASLPPVLSAAGSYALDATVTNTSGAPATLHGWIDFDRNGNFDTDEHASVAVADGTSGGTATLNWSGLSGGVAGDSFVRLRLTTHAGVTGATPASVAPDGEVEDYTVAISNPYQPVVPAGHCQMSHAGWVGPMSGFSNDDNFLRTGWTYDLDNLPQRPNTTPDATGTFAIAGTSPIAELDLTTGPVGGIGESHVMVTRWQAPAGTSQTISVLDTGFAEHAILAVRDSAGNLLARSPASTGFHDQGSASHDMTVTMPANGVVLVYAWVADQAVNKGQFFPLCADFGDAPGYAEAAHPIDAALYMGASAPDRDEPGAGTGGTSDDANGTDDEDGVTLPALYQGVPARISVAVSENALNDGYLQGWIDWNGDGTFDPGEQIATDLQDNQTGDENAATGTIDFIVTPPVTATTSQTFARFRWSTAAGLDAATAAPDGEVEDYAVTVTAMSQMACDGTFYQVRGAVLTEVTLSYNSGTGQYDANFNNSPNSGSNKNGAWGVWENGDSVLGYGVLNNSSRLYAVDAAGSFVDLGLIDISAFSGASSFSRSAGDIDDDGNLYVFNVDNNRIYVVDRKQTPAVLTHNIAAGFGINAADFIYNGVDQVFYGIDSNARRVAAIKVDLTGAGSASLVRFGPTGPPYNDNFGAGWFDATGATLFGYRNTGGNVYQIDTGLNAGPGLNPTGTGTAFLLGSGPGAGGNDGLGCRGARPFPYGTLEGTVYVDADGDRVVDSGEGAAAGAGLTVELYSGGNLIRTVTTDANGEYRFPAVISDFVYRVRVPAFTVGPPGSAATRTVEFLDNVTVADGGVVSGLDFAYGPADYSDAPTGYGDTYHVTRTGYTLGAAVTTETAPVGNDGVSDADDGVTLPASLIQGVPATINVGVSGAGGYLQAWIDWNGDGDFDDTGEQVATDSQDGGTGDGDGAANGVIEVLVNPPVAPLSNPTFARFRWSTAAGLDVATAAPDGEVEDHPVTVLAGDFGDAPAALGYATTQADGGPRHTVNDPPQVRIGATPTDIDNGTLQDAGALADDQDGANDEDGGAALPGAFVPGQPFVFNLPIVGSGYLNVWIDWNGDGDFTDPGEQVASDQPVTAGAALVGGTVLGGLAAGPTFARFRVCQAQGDCDMPVGPSASGEVEDHQVTIVDPPISVSGTVFMDNGAAAGATAAHDGVQGAAEAGIAGIAVTAFDDNDGDGRPDAGEAVYGAATTAGDGGYLMALAPSAAGQQVTVAAALGEAQWLHASDNAAGGSLPGLSNPDPADGAVVFVPAAATAYTGVDFGQIDVPTLTEDRSRSAAPGAMVTFAHNYRMRTTGTVLFLVNTIGESPTASTFADVQLYRDVNGDQAFDPGDTPIAGAIPVVEGELIQIIARVQVAGGASTGAELVFDVVAFVDFAGDPLDIDPYRAVGDGGSCAAVTSLLPGGFDPDYCLANTDRVEVVAPVSLQIAKGVCNDSAAATAFGPLNAGSPGQILVYELTVTNPTSAPAFDVDVLDTTPAFTAAYGSTPAPPPGASLVPAPSHCPASTTSVPAGVSCLVGDPGNGGSGPVSWQCTGAFGPGAVARFYFQVQIQ